MENAASRKLLLSTLGEEIEQAARWLNTWPEPEPAEIRLRVQALREAAVVIGAHPLEKQLLELERTLLAGSQKTEQTARALYQLARLIGALENHQADLVRSWLEPFEQTLQHQQAALATLERQLEQLQWLAGQLRATERTLFTDLLQETRHASTEVRQAQVTLQQAQNGLCRLLAESTRASPAPLFAALREEAGQLFLNQGRPGTLLIESAGLRLPVELYPPLEKVLRLLLARLIEHWPRPPRSRSRPAVCTLTLRQLFAAGMPLIELTADDLPGLDWRPMVESLQTELGQLRARLGERREGRPRLRLSVAAWPGLEQVLGVDSAVGRCWLRTTALETLLDAGQAADHRPVVGPPAEGLAQLAVFRWEEKEYYWPVTLREPPRWTSIRLPPPAAPAWVTGETHFGQPVVHPWFWLPMGENETCLFP